jgi:hypothetical protein
MKIRSAAIDIQKSEEIVESSFGISVEDSAHILSILRDKLYSNKVLAVIREYSTNAYDAHVEAGIPDRPIEVTLPSRLDSTLSIRDYGIGLTEEDVRNIYAMYGASTKRSSNAFTGQLGLGCLTKGEPITTITGVSPVEEIKEGDLVLTHTGNWKTVTSTMKREHKGKAYKIYLSQGGDPLVITDEHPILIANSKGEVTWKLPGEIITGYKKKRKGIYYWNSYAVLPKTIGNKISEIKLIDYLDSSFIYKNNTLHHLTSWKQTNRSTSTPFTNHKEFEWKNFPERLEMNYENGWLLGLWTAEGSAGEKNLNLTLHIEEKDLAKRFIAGMKKSFNIDFIVYERKERNSQELVASSVPVATILNTLCGHLSKNKHVPLEVMASNKEMRKGFLEGVLDGDGSSTRDQFCFGVSSINLAWGVRTLMIEQGIWGTVGFMESPGTKENTNPRWSINYNKNPKWKYHFESDEYLCRPITKIEEIDLDETVYNFSVEEDESYIGPFVLHNCKSGFSYADRFSITCWKNKERKEYCAYLDESTKGKIALMHTQPDDQEDGVCIQIPVEPKDINTFKSVAESFFPYFLTTPIVRGATIEPPEAVISDEFDIVEDSAIHHIKYALSQRANYYGANSGDKIIMGNIPYSIDYDQVIRNNTKLQITVWVPIGTVDIAANRETLEYTKETISFINFVIEKINSRYLAKIQSQIQLSPTLKGARRLVSDLGIERYNSILEELSWKDSNGKEYPIDDYLIREQTNSDDDKKTTPGGFKLYWSYKNYRKRNYDETHSISHYRTNDNLKVMLVDKKCQWKTKTTQWLNQENNLEQQLVIVVPDLSSSKFDWQKTVDHWRLHEYDIIKITDIVLKRSEKIIVNGKKIVRGTEHIGDVFQLKAPGSRTNTGKPSVDSWIKTSWKEANVLDKKFYIKIYNFELRNSADSIIQKVALDLLLHAHNELYPNEKIEYTNIFGVKKTEKVDEDWIEIFPYLESKIKTEENIRLAVETIVYTSRIEGGGLDSFFKKMIDIKDKNCIAYRLLSKAEELAVIAEKGKRCDVERALGYYDSLKHVSCYSNSTSIANEDGQKISPLLKEIEELYESAENRYPLTNVAGWFPKFYSYYGSQLEEYKKIEVINYINLIEGERK